MEREAGILTGHWAGRRPVALWPTLPSLACLDAGSPCLLHSALPPRCSHPGDPAPPTPARPFSRRDWEL